MQIRMLQLSKESFQKVSFDLNLSLCTKMKKIVTKYVIFYSNN